MSESPNKKSDDEKSFNSNNSFISDLTEDSFENSSSSGLFKADKFSYSSDDLIDFFQEAKNSLNLENKTIKQAIKEKLSEIKKELKSLENKPDNLLFTSTLLNISHTEKQIELYNKQLNLITSFKSQNSLKNNSSENEKLEVKNYLKETDVKITILGIINHQLSSSFNEEQKEVFKDSREIISQYRLIKDSNSNISQQLTEDFIAKYSNDLNKIFSDSIVDSVIEIFEKIITENHKKIAANISETEFNSFSQTINKLLDEQAKFTQIISNDNIIEKIEESLKNEKKESGKDDSYVPSSVFENAGNSQLLTDSPRSQQSSLN